MYLDNNATTPLDPLVREAMIEAFDLYNPSSMHTYGQEAKKKLTHARSVIADFFSIAPREITFTSSGTEAMNFLIRGLYKGGPIVTTKIEHSCIHNTILSLTDDIIYLPVDEYGAPTSFDTIPPDALVVLSAVNGETGVKLDLDSVAALNATTIIDGVALLGKEPVTIPRGITAIGFSAHKFHGPKGAGLAICRLPLSPLITGGPQEHNLRAGTENLPGIIGMRRAIELIPKTTNMATLRDHFEKSLAEKLSIDINGTGPRVCNTLNIAFTGVDGESLLIALDMAGVAASAGSACSAGAIEPSRVLLGMGYSRERALSSLRFSLSRMTTADEIDRAIETITACVAKLT